MASIYLSTLQLSFIIVGSVVVLALLIIFAIIPLTKKLKKKHYQYFSYKKLYSIAENNDYLLINNFVIPGDNKSVDKIDHILFGDKYIYVVIDKCYPFDVVGKASDPSFVLVSKEGQKKDYIDNLHISLSRLLSKFAASTGISTELMIGVVVTNNECRIAIETTSKQFFIVQNKKVTSLIKEIESREVPTINAKALEKAVLTVNNINIKNKEKIKKKAA